MKWKWSSKYHADGYHNKFLSIFTSTLLITIFPLSQSHQFLQFLQPSLQKSQRLEVKMQKIYKRFSRHLEEFAKSALECKMNPPPQICHKEIFPESSAANYQGSDRRHTFLGHNVFVADAKLCIFQVYISLFFEGITSSHVGFFEELDSSISAKELKSIKEKNFSWSYGGVAILCCSFSNCFCKLFFVYI